MQPDENNAIFHVSASDADLGARLSYTIISQETCCGTDCTPLVRLAFLFNYVLLVIYYEADLTLPLCVLVTKIKEISESNLN